MYLTWCVLLQHTLETALLSASQEIELGSDNPAAMQSVVQQRDLLQSGLLSTCREVSRVTAVSNTVHSHSRQWRPLGVLFFRSINNMVVFLCLLYNCCFYPPQEVERLWREYDRMEGDVTMAKNNLLEQLETLGSPQVGTFLTMSLLNFFSLKAIKLWACWGKNSTKFGIIRKWSCNV